MEYFEATGSALAVLEIGYVDQFADWKAEYFNNPNVEGSPAVVRNEADINHNWGNASPAPGIQNDNFSARWSRRTGFEESNYLFRVTVEGGTRLWLDGVLLIDNWTSQGLRTLEAESGKISKGDHDLRVDYFKAAGNGQITVRWEKLGEAGPQPPKAVINGTNRAQVGQTVNFNARNSWVADGSHINVFDWDFGDGSKATGIEVSHQYEDPGNYEVSLVVIDDKELSNRATHSIEITDAPVTPGQPPQAVIVAPTEAGVGQPVTFDASKSTGDSSIVSYAWDFGDGTTANAVQVDKTYQTPGIFNVILTVTDQEGLQGTTNSQIGITEIVGPTPEFTPTPTEEATAEPTLTEEATVEPTPTVEPGDIGPTAVITGPTTAGVDQLITFNASQSQPGSSNITSYEWDFGDGINTSTEVTADQTYTQAGNYTVTLTVTDENALQDQDTWQIEITEAQVEPLDEG